MAASFRSIAAAALLGGCLASCAGHAAAPDGTLTVFRCVASDGAVALQDTPCAAGEDQQRRDLARPRSGAPASPPPQPAAEQAASQAAPPAVQAQAAIDADAEAAPPPLWDCVRHDGSRYESDTGVPQRRWVPLWVLGADPRAPPSWIGEPGAPRPVPPRRGPGAPELPAATGLALSPGAWVEDRCRRLPDGEACARHAARRDALRREWQRAMPSGRDRIRPEERALSAMLRRSCGRS